MEQVGLSAPRPPAAVGKERVGHAASHRLHPPPDRRGACPRRLPNSIHDVLSRCSAQTLSRAPRSPSAKEQVSGRGICAGGTPGVRDPGGRARDPGGCRPPAPRVRGRRTTSHRREAAWARRRGDYPGETCPRSGLCPRPAPGAPCRAPRTPPAPGTRHAEAAAARASPASRGERGRKGGPPLLPMVCDARPTKLKELAKRQLRANTSSAQSP